MAIWNPVTQEQFDRWVAVRVVRFKDDERCPLLDLWHDYLDFSNMRMEAAAQSLGRKRFAQMLDAAGFKRIRSGRYFVLGVGIRQGI